jgi:phosphoserine phosphatase RsbU/P
MATASTTRTTTGASGRPQPSREGGDSLQCLQVWGDNRATDNGVVMPGLDAWVYSRPAGTADAGGDVYYLSSCATGRIIRLLVADVSGHGDSVAAVAGRLRSLMRRYMNHADQRRLLREINRAFMDLSRLGQFATASVISCWTPTGELTVSNAGHPSPLRFDAAAGRWAPLFDIGEHANVPLGIDPDTEFEQVRIRLGREDMLMVFSDGLIEDPDASGRRLQQPGVLELLNGLGGLPPERVISELIGRTSARRGGGPSEDDTTVLLMRPNNLAPKASLLGGLAAGLRLARSLASSVVRPGPSPVPQINATNMLGAFHDRFNRSRG